jgi:hypothetical protein
MTIINHLSMVEWRYSDCICMVLCGCFLQPAELICFTAPNWREVPKMFQMCLKDFENRFRMFAALHVSKLRLITLCIRMTLAQHAWKSRVSEVSRVQSLKSSSGLAEVWHVDTMWTTKKWHEDPIEVQHSADILSFWHVNIDYAMHDCAAVLLLSFCHTVTQLCQAMPGHLPWPEAKTFTLPWGEVVWCDGEIPFWSIHSKECARMDVLLYFRSFSISLTQSGDATSKSSLLEGRLVSSFSASFSPADDTTSWQSVRGNRLVTTCWVHVWQFSSIQLSLKILNISCLP